MGLGWIAGLLEKCDINGYRLWKLQDQNVWIQNSAMVESFQFIFSRVPLLCCALLLGKTMVPKFYIENTIYYSTSYSDAGYSPIYDIMTQNHDAYWASQKYSLERLFPPSASDHFSRNMTGYQF
jgi:hypothetical protein